MLGRSLFHLGSQPRSQSQNSSIKAITMAMAKIIRAIPPQASNGTSPDPEKSKKYSPLFCTNQYVSIRPPAEASKPMRVKVVTRMKVVVNAQHLQLLRPENVQGQLHSTVVALSGMCSARSRVTKKTVSCILTAPQVPFSWIRWDKVKSLPLMPWLVLTATSKMGQTGRDLLLYSLPLAHFTSVLGNWVKSDEKRLQLRKGHDLHASK